jgi:hypothetical protein
MVAQDKLKVEGGLRETKVILGWHFNLWTLTVTLSKHEHIAWLGKIWKMIANGKTTKKALELRIRQFGDIGFFIPWVFQFLSRLRTLLAQACNRCVITINKECKNDLALILKILDKAMRGIDMNLLGFHSPDRIYYSDSYPVSLGRHSNQDFAWRFQIPDNLLFCAANNLLKFLAAIITLWIDIIGRCLSPGDYALPMTDSATTKG